MNAGLVHLIKILAKTQGLNVCARWASPCLLMTDCGSFKEEKLDRLQLVYFAKLKSSTSMQWLSTGIFLFNDS